MTRTSNPVYCTWYHRKQLPPDLKDRLRDLDQLLRNLCSSAEQRLIIVAPFISSEGISILRSSIAISAQKGAWLRLVTSNLDEQNSMNRRAIDKLIESDEEGSLIRPRLRILTGSSNFPFFIHSKIILVDRQFGYLGSANFSKSALDENFEVGVFLQREQVETLDELITYFEVKGYIHDTTDSISR